MKLTIAADPGRRRPGCVACASGDAPKPAAVSKLPPMPQPADNPATPAKVALGKQLFADPRLSGSGKMACQSCHYRNLGWTDAQVLSRKDDGNLNTRHTPTLYNVGYQTAWYWDGRATTLEGQILAAWRAQIGADPAKATAVINAVPGYRSQFIAVWGSRGHARHHRQVAGRVLPHLRQHRFAVGPLRGRRQQRGVEGCDRRPGAVCRQGPLHHLPRAAVLRQQHVLQHRPGAGQGQARPGPLQRHQERGRPRRLQDADAALGGASRRRTSTTAAWPR